MRDGRLGWAAQRTIAPPYGEWPVLVPGLCHRVWALVRITSYGIAKRAAELLQACPTPLSAPQDRGAWVPSDALDDPSAASAEGDPRDAEVPSEQRATAALPQETALPAQYLQLIDDKPFVKYAGLLTMAHAQGLQRLEAWFTG